MLPPADHWDALDWQAVLSQPAEYAAKGGDAGPITESVIAEVLWMYALSPDGWASKDFACVAQLTDGWFAVCEAWADTSGWGCRSAVTWKVAHTLDEALTELSPQNRALWDAFPDGWKVPRTLTPTLTP